MPIFSSTAPAGTSDATVGSIVDRVYRDYLESPDDQAVMLTVTSAVAADATTIAYADSTLAPDEEDLLAPGVLIEAAGEQMRVIDADSGGNTVTVTRGVNGTEPAAIAAGDEITVAPLYSRRSVYDAVCDNIAGLYPDLSVMGTTTLTSASTPVEVTSEVVAVHAARRITGSSVSSVNVELLRNWPPSTTGQALVFSGVSPGSSVYVTYEARFPRPTSEADVLGDLGVDATWERIIVVGAAAQVVGGRDLDPLSQEYIVEALEREGLPVGSAQRVRNGLLQLHQSYLTQARRNLRATRAAPVVVYR